MQLETTVIIIMVVLAVLSGYIFTSVLFLKFPIFHKRKQLKFRPKHISHRGGAGENLENTMTAFKHAEQLGTEMLELDCHITKDGKVVVAHDGSLKRSCGVEGYIRDFNYKDLPNMNCNLTLDFQSTFSCLGGEDRKIPLLEEVFRAFPNLPINVDIKDDDDELIEKVNQLIIQFNREHLTAWGNRKNVVASKLYKINPNIPLFCSLKRVAVLVLLFYSGLLPFIPLKESLFEIIMPSILLDEKKFRMGFDRKTRFLFRLIDRLIMSPVLFRHLEKRGIQTYLWVLNNEEEFERGFKSGAAGIMTDFPTKLKDFLDSHPEYRTRHTIL